MRERRSLVCKRLFLAMLGFVAHTDRIIHTVMKYIASNSVSPPEDKRCRKPPHNKMDDELIQSLNPERSHYSRDHAPERRYLSSDLTIKMHQDIISQATNFLCCYNKYRNVLSEIKISFSNVGHKEC